MYRSPDIQDKYEEYIKQSNKQHCIFCFPPKRKIVGESENFWILKNDFPYAIWDFHQVIKHLMIVPKKHSFSVAEFSEQIKKEYTNTISKFESQGYDIYTRTNKNNSRSMEHFHTHLIKCNNHRLISLVYKKDPYTSEAKFD